ncbi:MAG: transketolase C-terminal domain-containing protein [Candidatus Campbellbacteria bacterium]|nr:transketolase C-terminal domain-containing protein [Candidatus Campbellbacteria bacterium]
MIREEQKLVENIFNIEEIEQVPTRNGFGDGLAEVGDRDESVVAVCADLAGSTRTEKFRQKFPDRYIEAGVAEQNMAALASGLANYGKIPYIASYAAFSPGRNNEQIRTTISLNNVPVKIVGAHSGVSVGPDGATHQALEDIALMRVQPNMKVIVPADAEEARKATHVAYETNSPVYIRLTREKTPLFTTHDSPFEFGKANVLFDPDEAEVTIFTCGPLTYNALFAAHELEEEGIRVAVVNVHTVKPLDEETILSFAERTNAVVSVEEHQVAGGLGSAISEFLSQRHPSPQEFVGVFDRFGQSGEPEELIEHYGMDVGSIKEAVRKVISRKQ